MFQPLADIVVTVIGNEFKILVDFAIPVDGKMMEKVFDGLTENQAGIQCSIGKESCSITYTRIWRGEEIASELRRLLQLEDTEINILCLIEGEDVKRTKIRSKEEEAATRLWVTGLRD